MQQPQTRRGIIGEHDVGLAFTFVAEPRHDHGVEAQQLARRTARHPHQVRHQALGVDASNRPP
ncbi:hypothetical protein [Saccharopolyspora spinosa]|uniref:hypothetical protein n=1 Tax=Saccharopolyspora spinosa TaxID=60894 RepID=UPI0002DFA6F9|nr:hypothetical protein [Saccharopolyspora spinosa]